MNRFDSRRFASRRARAPPCPRLAASRRPSPSPSSSRARARVAARARSRVVVCGVGLNVRDVCDRGASLFAHTTRHTSTRGARAAPRCRSR
jgi:hypothetical protein